MVEQVKGQLVGEIITSYLSAIMRCQTVESLFEPSITMVKDVASLVLLDTIVEFHQQKRQELPLVSNTQFDDIQEVDKFKICPTIEESKQDMSEQQVVIMLLKEQRSAEYKVIEIQSQLNTLLCQKNLATQISDTLQEYGSNEVFSKTLELVGLLELQMKRLKKESKSTNKIAIQLTQKIDDELRLRNEQNQQKNLQLENKIQDLLLELGQQPQQPQQQSSLIQKIQLGVQQKKLLQRIVSPFIPIEYKQQQRSYYNNFGPRDNYFFQDLQLSYDVQLKKIFTKPGSWCFNFVFSNGWSSNLNTLDLETDEFLINQPIRRIVTWHSPELLLLAVWLYTDKYYEWQKELPIAFSCERDKAIQNNLCSKCGSEMHYIHCSNTSHCGRTQYCSRRQPCRKLFHCVNSKICYDYYQNFSYREHEAILEQNERIIGFKSKKGYINPAWHYDFQFIIGRME